MATITSLGIGTNGLDSESIVTKLVALEKQPLTALQNAATIGKAKISAFGQIQSQFSTLADVATQLSSPSAWVARTASSSNSNVASITATSTAAATSFTLDVDALAKEQSISSASMGLNSAVGAGTMTIRAGTWSGGAADAGTANAAVAAADALVTSTAATAASAANSAANALANDNQAAGDLATEALNTPSLSNYSSAYSSWVAAIAANDHSTPSLIAAEANALATKNAEYAALSGADQATANAITATADATDASALKAASISAAAAASAAVAAASSARPTFTAASGSSDLSIVVTAADTITTLAAKINTANAGVVATVFKDGTGERLLLRSKSTGADSGFRIQVADADTTNSDNTGLSRFAYDPQTAAFGMASSGIPAQYGQDAKARINGLPVTSKTNTLTDNVPGVTINLSATTTTGYGTSGEVKSPITMSVSENVTAAVKNVQDFITAYNALASDLADVTKYDASTKTPSIFQGDSSVVGMQSVLRNMIGSISNGSVYKRLSDVGIERQLDGTLSLNTTKLAAAANNGTELQKFFTADNKDPQTNGVALKFAAFGKGVLSSGGTVANKAAALQKQLDTNSADQTRINDRAAAFETRLRAQYSALDAKMASLNALNAYVSQQVTTWNKSTG